MCRFVLLAGSLLSLFMLSGCGIGGYYAGVTVGPPAPLVETPYGVAPGPDYIWTPGFYDWDGNNWAWRHGAWRRPPHHGDHYVPTHWDHERGGYRVHRSHWEHGDHHHH